MPLAGVQPAAVRRLIGDEYSNFSGPLFKRGKFGRTAEYRTKFTVAGTVDVAADAARSTQTVKEAFAQARKNCYAITGTAEALTGQKATTAQRRRFTDQCLADVHAEERKEAARKR